ncbi:MAG: DUF3574 domain-containing protein [Streptomyces sp.]
MNVQIKNRYLAAAAAVLALTAAAPTAYAALDTPPVQGETYTETRLLFGTVDPDGGPAVTDKQFRTFLDKHVTPHFPRGLTVQDGRGQYRDRNGRIERERSYELTLLIPSSEAGAHETDIQHIRREYRRLYKQESVLRADDTARVDY